MPFDPHLPQEGTDLDAAQMRSQLVGLRDLIDAILTITAAEVDGVTTLPAGSAAAASVAVVGHTLHFTFSIPQGTDGGQGPQGPAGGQGPQGPPFAEAVVDAVSTLDPGMPATVSVAFDGTNVRFTFGLPRGFDGEPGPPGEINSAQLADAIQTTSANSNVVAELAGAISDPPQQMEVQAIADKLDELILALRRT